MSKQIEPSPFLSDFDRQYLIARGRNPDDFVVEATEENADEIPPYTEWKVAELQLEIDRRNNEYAEADVADEDVVVIDPASDRKADLIAALEADDERVASSDDEDGA